MKNIPLLLNTNVADLVTSVLQLYIQSPILVSSSCRLIYSLSKSERIVDKLSYAFAGDALLNAVFLYKAQPLILIESLRALTKLTQNNTSKNKQSLLIRTCQLLIYLLQIYFDDAYLIENILLTLQSLISRYEFINFPKNIESAFTFFILFFYS